MAQVMQQIPEISPENLDRFKGLAQKNLDFWQTLSAEEKQKGIDQSRRMKEDPSIMQERLLEIMADFDAADADGDGRLNQAEYEAFLQGQKAKADSRNEFMARYDGYSQDSYALFNSVSADSEGITKEEWLSFVGRIMAVYKELAQAQGIEV
mmetsp:Transcript_27681/g.36954  ORF Transcript_27681/g.36954 Transcript_27681/m.36954 type:complete len:152 (-) Transcript_27681:113-568(-)